MWNKLIPCAALVVSAMATGAVEDIQSMSRESDGNFAITCQNGDQQTLSAGAILENKPCGGPVIHPKIVKSVWTMSGHWKHWDCSKLFSKAKLDSNGSAIGNLKEKCLNKGYYGPNSFASVSRSDCRYEDDFYSVQVTFVGVCTEPIQRKR